jgi:nucleoside-diphosphate-sugar epimerase
MNITIKKRIALLGGSGFIGTELMKMSINHGWKLRVLTRNPNGWESHTSVEILVGDLSDDNDWSKFVKDVDVIINCAGEFKISSLMMDVNIRGPLSLLNSAISAGVKRWVQLSSVGAYGPCRFGFINEDSEECPEGIYEITKTAFDHILIQMSKKYNIEYAILRPSIVYGIGMKNQSLIQLMKKIRQRLFFFIGPKGATVNYIHVNDVAKALILCAEHHRAVDKIYILSEYITIEEMVQIILDEFKIKLIIQRIPLFIARFFAHIFYRWRSFPLTISRVNALSTFVRYDMTLIKHDLGMTINRPIKDGLREFANDLDKKIKN